VDAEGGARIEEVYPSELDALRATRATRPTRKVPVPARYGIAVSRLDSPE